MAGADLRGADPRRLEAGFDAFRRCFPAYRYHAKIVPDDEIICLRLFFREDDVLDRLFLDDGRRRQLDRLWTELRYVSQQPLVEERNYPQFLGFVSQDGPEPLRKFKTTTEQGVHQRAAEFTKDLEAAAPKQLDALLDFASRAYRRPLEEKEKTDLRNLYDALRKKEMTHEEAFRLVLTRVLVSPAFLYRIEQPAAGQGSQPVSPWELATRLSYFLWATTPDAELRDAAAGRQAGRRRRPGGADRPDAQGPADARPGDRVRRRSGCTSATSRATRRRTKSCFPPSTTSFARACSRKRSSSSRTCFRTTAPSWRSSTPTTRSSTRRWPSITAFRTSPGRSGGAWTASSSTAAAACWRWAAS